MSIVEQQLNLPEEFLEESDKCSEISVNYWRVKEDISDFSCGEDYNDQNVFKAKKKG